ncbi:MAG TPA: flagellar hook protein FlgE [Rhizomicrobium sp.]|jgi:flagellar hook protein FlgE|nr:flagellar hook protein FlgE [Rhizomicrobium sp.]
MSLYGALTTGVAGLNANSTALSVASANIANVNTVGYKAGTASFSTLLASAMGTSDVSNAGVTATAGQNVTQQGLPTSTSSSTDMAISGNGMFVVTQTPTSPGGTSSLYFTRAGSFVPDSNGNLQNAAGYYLMGWPLDSTGNVPTDRNDLTAVNINQLSGKAEATTTMSIQANLQASTTAATGYTAGDMSLDPTDANYVAPAFQRSTNVYDSQGGQQPLQISYVKTGANAWSYEVSYQGDDTNLSSANPIATGNLSFNSDGALVGVTDTTTGGTTPSGSGTVDVNIPWDSTTSGLQPQSIALNFGTLGASDGITQFDTDSTQTSSKVDGALFGSLSSVSVDANGYVTANFSNGLTQKIYKVPLATFANEDGLSQVSGNAYQVSNASGTPTIGEANTGGAGSVDSKALEGSTVDLATEFTNLITTQRAYSASARIITTASDMLDQLLQMSH